MFVTALYVDTCEAQFPDDLIPKRGAQFYRSAILTYVFGYILRGNIKVYVHFFQR